MPKSYAGHVIGKVGNRAVPPKGGNSPTVPSSPQAIGLPRVKSTVVLNTAVNRS